MLGSPSSGRKSIETQDQTRTSGTLGAAGAVSPGLGLYPMFSLWEWKVSHGYIINGKSMESEYLLANIP